MTIWWLSRFNFVTKFSWFTTSVMILNIISGTGTYNTTRPGSENITFCNTRHNGSQDKNISCLPSQNRFVDRCTESLPLETRNLLQAIFVVTVFVVGFIGNSAVCFVVFYSRILRSQAVNRFLVSLAVSDILVVLFTCPTKIHQLLHNQSFCFNLGLCYVYILSDIFSNAASVTNLFFICINRYLAITRPLKHIRVMSPYRANCVIAICWIYAGLWSGLSVLNWSGFDLQVVQIARFPTGVKLCMTINPLYWTTVYAVLFILPIFLMGFCYIAIWKEVRTQNKRMAELADGTLQKKTRASNEVKLTRTLAIVYGVFSICWLPVCILTITTSWCRNCFVELRTKHPKVFEGIFVICVQVLPLLSSALNPFIYFFSGEQFRKVFSFKKVFRHTMLTDVSRRSSIQSRESRL